MGGGNYGPPPNFVVSGSITIKFGVLYLTSLFQNRRKSFENDVTADLCRHLLSQATVSFEISNFFISGRI